MRNLLLALLLTFIPAGAWGAYSGSGAGTADNPYLVTTAAQLTEVFDTYGGYARLEYNVTGGFTVNAPNPVYLDLNGKSITFSGSVAFPPYGTVIVINSGKTLTIDDHSVNHDGRITGGNNNTYSLNYYGDRCGGGIRNSGTFYFQGGIITENHGVDAAGVCNLGTMEMSGGEISNNTASYSGYGIANWGTSADLKITGGRIINNTGDISPGRGGGIIHGGRSFTLSGSPTISGNHKTNNPSNTSNIWIYESRTINIGEGGLNVADGSIGVRRGPGNGTGVIGAFTTGSTSDETYKKFFVEYNDFEIYNTDDHQAAFRTCWEGLRLLIAAGGNDDEMDASKGKVVLQRDYQAISSDLCFTFPSTRPMTLNLNGHTLDRNRANSTTSDGCVIKNEGALTIIDTSAGGEGTIKGGNSSDYGGGIYNAGSLTIDGGTISGNKTTSLGAGIYNETSGTVILNSGNIQNNTNSGEHGGGIYNKGELTINGGAIISNTLSAASKNGGGIYNAGTLSINGGTIQNNTVKDNTGLGAGIYHDGTAFNLQGAPDISSNKIVNTSTQCNVYLTTDKKITITGALTNTPAIGINMQTLGKFTTEFKTYNCSLDKFSSEAGVTVKLTNYNADFTLTEAELITYWSYLNRLFSDGSKTEIILEAGTYQATSTESYLHVPNRTVSLNLNGQTLNRNVTTAKENGCVLYNEGNLTITGTGTIRGGNNTGTGTAQGGGIYNTHELILNGGTISGNTSSRRGGGIYNEGTLTINGASVQIQGNASSLEGRGVFNKAGCEMTLSAGYIQNNTGGIDHGGGVYNEGTLNMTGGTISGNTINTTNTTDKHGGGVYNEGTMTFSGGNIQGNWARGDGGGIYNNGTLTMSGGSILNNGYYTSGSDTYYRGENGTGIYNNGTLNLTGGTITGNRFDGSSKEGAGIYNNGTFNLEGAPTITSNTRNVYLTEAHHIINIKGALTNATKIGIRMEKPGVFTSGLGNHGGGANSEKFTSEDWRYRKLVDTDLTNPLTTANEAALLTHWNYLQRLIDNVEDNGLIELENSCYYEASSTDTYLHVPDGKTFTLNLNGNTIDRKLTSNTSTTPKADGCVIFNEGNLTITGSGTIRGGSNTDATDIKGGGICNVGSLIIQGGTIRNNTTYSHGGGIYNYGTTAGKGVLTIEGGTIQYNGVTNSSYGGGIYHNGTTFKMKGDPYILGNTANSADNNIYLESGKIITITDKLTSTSTTPQIGITSKDDHPVFTSGLKGYDDDATKRGDAKKFKADLTTHDIGLKSNGEAIVGPTYNVNRVNVGDYVYLYIKDNHTNQMTAVEGELVKVKIYGDGSRKTIPINLYATDDLLNVSYPEAGVVYQFVMPGNAVTVTGECRYGGYCGAANEKDIKYYLKDGTLYFMTKDANSYEMQNYAYESVPWSNLSYTAINIPNTVTTISDYAFYGKAITAASIHQGVTSIGVKAFMGCTSLPSIVADGSNENYSSSNGVLYNKDATTLICYPAGKEDFSYTLPTSVTSIAEGAFAYGSHLQTIEVAGGSSFKSVDGVLYNYAGTTLVYYPAGNNSVFYEVPTTATVGPYAFHNAKNLTHLFLLHNAVPTGSTAMFDESTFYIMVSNSIKSSYEGTSPWSNYATRYRSIALSNAAITLEYTSVDYNGTALEPNVISVIKDNRTLTPTTDYTVGYSNNTEVGTATVTVTGAGVYAGSHIDKTFTITRYVNFGTVTGQYVTYYASENLNRPADEHNSGYVENNSHWHPYRVYTITDIDWANNSITINLVSSTSDEKGYIPAGTPILLYNMCFNEVASPVFHLTKYTGTATSVSPSSYFKGVSTSTSYSELIASNADLYVLRNDKFVRATGGTLPANRCYIARPTSVSPSPAPAYLSISGIDDNTTGITMEGGRGKTEELFSADWYTVNGVKLDGMPTQKGIYINNSRKVIIK